MLVAPARDAAVEHIEEGRRRQRGGDEEIGRVAPRHVEHGEEDRAHAAGGVAQREQVGELQLAQHREVLGAFDRG